MSEESLPQVPSRVCRAWILQILFLAYSFSNFEETMAPTVLPANGNPL
jgi:hypothetical protein